MNEVQAVISQTMERMGAAQYQAPKVMDNVAKAEATGQEFEAVFLSQMLTPMFAGLEPDPFFGGGHAEKIYQSMMIQEYGKLLSDRGGVGVADSVTKTILDMQARQQNPIEGEAIAQ